MLLQSDQCPYGKRGPLGKDTGRTTGDGRGREWRETALSQGTSRLDSHHQKLKRGKEGLCPELRCLHSNDFELVVPWQETALCAFKLLRLGHYGTAALGKWIHCPFLGSPFGIYLHWKCLHVVDELCCSILCSSLWFGGKLINMIQKTENTNAEALTLSPHLLLFSIIAPNYLIGPLWLCSVTEKNTVYCETPSNHNAISNSIPIKSARC